MTLSAAISPATLTPVKTAVKPATPPKPVTPTPAVAVATPRPTAPTATSATVGPTAQPVTMRATAPATTTQAVSPTQVDIAPQASPAMTAATTTRPTRATAPAVQQASPAATSPTMTTTPPNRMDPMAINTTFSTTPIKTQTQTAAPTSPILIKPSAPQQATISLPIQTSQQQPAQQQQIQTAVQSVKTTAAPAQTPVANTIKLSPAQTAAIQQAATQAAQPSAGTSVKQGGFVNTGVVGPTAQTAAGSAPVSDLQRARDGLAAWLRDAGIYATMSPDAHLAGKNQIMSDPEASVVAKTMAALVTASTPQKATNQGEAILIIPDDTFAGYLGAFNLTKRLLALPESLSPPSAKTIEKSIPAIQALINLIDLALAGQALPTDIPAVLKDDEAFYTKWWFWTIIGVVGIGGAAYVARKRHA